MKKKTWHTLEALTGQDIHPEIRVGQYVVPNFVSNSVLIQLKTDEYLVISPGKALLTALPSEWSISTQPNDVKVHILMPNGYHYMGVSEWVDTFPNTTLYASEQAMTPLLDKGVVSHRSQLLDARLLEGLLPEGYQVVIPPGHRAGDVWITKDSHLSDAERLEQDPVFWIICDSFLNYDRLSNQPIARLSQRLLDAAPGLKMSQVVKWFIINDRPQFKRWALNQLQSDKPQLLIPSHGEVKLDRQLPEQLTELIEARL